MPYSNLHAARQNDPSKYRRIRSLLPSKGITLLGGFPKDGGPSEVQSVHFAATKWSAADALAWLKKKGYDVTQFEKATEYDLDKGALKPYAPECSDAGEVFATLRELAKGEYDENKVKRDKGGQFAKVEGRVGGQESQGKEAAATPEAAGVSQSQVEGWIHDQGDSESHLPYDFEHAASTGELRTHKSSSRKSAETHLSKEVTTDAHFTQDDADKVTAEWMGKNFAKLKDAKDANELFHLLDDFSTTWYEAKSAAKAKVDDRLRESIVAKKKLREATHPGPVTDTDTAMRWAAQGAHPEPLYHATTAGPQVMQTGLKSREQLGGKQTLGGGADHTVSLASTPEGGKYIAAALQAINESHENPDVVKWFDENWPMQEMDPTAKADVASADKRHATNPPERVRARINAMGWDQNVKGGTDMRLRVPVVLTAPPRVDPKSIGVVTAHANVDSILSDKPTLNSKVLRGLGAGYRNAERGSAGEYKNIYTPTDPMNGAAYMTESGNVSEAGEKRAVPEHLTVSKFEPVLDWRSILGGSQMSKGFTGPDRRNVAKILDSLRELYTSPSADLSKGHIPDDSIDGWITMPSGEGNNGRRVPIKHVTVSPGRVVYRVHPDWHPEHAVSYDKGKPVQPSAAEVKSRAEGLAALKAKTFELTGADLAKHREIAKKIAESGDAVAVERAKKLEAPESTPALKEGVILANKAEEGKVYQTAKGTRYTVTKAGEEPEVRGEDGKVWRLKATTQLKEVVPEVKIAPEPVNLTASTATVGQRYKTPKGHEVEVLGAAGKDGSVPVKVVATGKEIRVPGSQVLVGEPVDAQPAGVDVAPEKPVETVQPVTPEKPVDARPAVAEIVPESPAILNSMRHEEVGEHVPFSRKDTAIATGPQAVADVSPEEVKRDDVLKRISPEQAQERGMTPGGHYLHDYLIKSVGVDPFSYRSNAFQRRYWSLRKETTPEQRGEIFKEASALLQNSLDRCKTAADVQAMVMEFRDLARAKVDEVVHPSTNFDDATDEARMQAKHNNPNLKVSGVSFENGRTIKDIVDIPKHEYYTRLFDSLGERFGQIVESGRIDVTDGGAKALATAKELTTKGWGKAKATDADVATDAAAKRFGWSQLRGENDGERSGGRRISEISGEKLAKEFGIKNIQYGDWLSQADRAAHLKEAHGAMYDLADALGVSDAALGLSGKVALSFGGRGQGRLGSGNAHYEPQFEIINLTKHSGSGSLSHEMVHAIDDIVTKLHGGTHETHASSGVYPEGMPARVREAYDDLSAAVHGPAWRATKDLYTARALLAKYKASHAPDGLVAMARRAVVHAEEALKAAPTTQFKRDAQVLGEKYWATPSEMFARVGEAYVQDKLSEMGRKSSYLVRGTDRYHRTFEARLPDPSEKAKATELAKQAALKHPSVVEARNTAAEKLRAYQERVDAHMQKKYPKEYSAKASFASAARFQQLQEQEVNALPELGLLRSEYSRANIVAQNALKQVIQAAPSAFLPMDPNDPTTHAQPYPQGEERKAMTQAFGRFVEALKEEGLLEKAMRKGFESMRSNRFDKLREILLRRD